MGWKSIGERSSCERDGMTRCDGGGAVGGGNTGGGGGEGGSGGGGGDGGRRVSGRDEEGLSYLPLARGAALATSFVHTLCTHDGGRERVWRAGTDSLANTRREIGVFCFLFLFSRFFFS